jgi:hypothetical protein
MSGMWQRLGFQENPYFATPIEISDDGRNLFVGRAAEVRRMIGKWDDTAGTITVIGGHIGTGKTSFLNVCQYLCMTGIKDYQLPYAPPRLIPAFVKTQIETGLAERDLLVRIIRSAVESIRITCATLSLEIPVEAASLASWLSTLSSSASTGTGGGLKIMGTGIDVSESSGSTNRQVADIPVDALMGKLELLAREVTTIDFRGIIIALDNIELVDSGHIVELMNRYRDTLFSIKGIWWVLIGQKGLYDLIQAEAPRVSQRIKGTETTLEGLSWPDFHLAIDVRKDHFKTRPNAIAPIGDDLLKTLFDASMGEIRYVFQMADSIVTDAIAEDPALTAIPPEFADQLLRASVLGQIRQAHLSSREKRVLKKMCEGGTVRPKDYKEYGFQNAPNFIQSTLLPLHEKGLVTKSTQGNAAMYSPRSLARLAGSFAFLNEDQTFLFSE